GRKANDMQNRAEILTVELTQRADLVHCRSDECAVLRLRRKFEAADALRILVQPSEMVVERFLRVGVDHRSDIGGQLARIAIAEGPHRAGDHVDHAGGHISLEEKDAKRRTALASALEG